MRFLAPVLAALVLPLSGNAEERVRILIERDPEVGEVLVHRMPCPDRCELRPLLGELVMIRRLGKGRALISGCPSEIVAESCLFRAERDTTITIRRLGGSSATNGEASVLGYGVPRESIEDDGDRLEMRSSSRR